MAVPKKLPKNFSELIDQIERIQQELLNIQRSLEKMEPAERSIHGKTAK